MTAKKFEPSRHKSAKISDLTTTVDSEVVQTDAGPVVWGSVEITYVFDGLEPRMSIRVPVPAFETQSDEQRRSEALRRARQLIDHACSFIDPPQPSANLAETLEGLSEELGLSWPTTQPQRWRGA